MAPDHEFNKLKQRVIDLEDEAGKNAERYDEIKQLLTNLNIAVAGDPKHDILGLVGRMRLIDQEIANLKQWQVNRDLEWQAMKNQALGASKLGRLLWAIGGAIVGSGALTLAWQIIKAFAAAS